MVYVKKSLVDYYPVRLIISEFTVLQSHTSKKKVDKIYVEQSVILFSVEHIMKLSPLILMIRVPLKNFRGHSAI